MLRAFVREGGIRKVKSATTEPIKQWRVVRGDLVEVLAGPDKKKQGKVVKIMRDTNRVVVEGLNLVRLSAVWLHFLVAHRPVSPTPPPPRPALFPSLDKFSGTKAR